MCEGLALHACSVSSSLLQWAGGVRRQKAPRALHDTFNSRLTQMLMQMLAFTPRAILAAGLSSCGLSRVINPHAPLNTAHQYISRKVSAGSDVDRPVPPPSLPPARPPARPRLLCSHHRPPQASPHCHNPAHQFDGVECGGRTSAFTTCLEPRHHGSLKT